jgi:hypothetical protein
MFQYNKSHSKHFLYYLGGNLVREININAGMFGLTAGNAKVHCLRLESTTAKNARSRQRRSCQSRCTISEAKSS